MTAAQEANAPGAWDEIWSREGGDTWRAQAMAATYDRVCAIVGAGDGAVVDLGGGIGLLAERLRAAGWGALVVDHSAAAVRQAQDRGLEARCARVEELEGELVELVGDDGWLVATEMIEHLEADVRDRLLEELAAGGVRCMFSVPDNRLGPDEEPQHTIKWTAVEFAAYLRRFFEHVRVECMPGGYLLGVCGVPKRFTLSVCLPARDEAEDIVRTLATYRGIADEIVVGVDPRTTDDTAELARAYADIVFELDSPTGPPGEQVPGDGVHFAHIRNQCIERCSGEWIFMTEAHELLASGVDELLTLDQVPAEVEVGFVIRHIRDNNRMKCWAHAWLFRNVPHLRYTRSTHNALTIDECAADKWLRLPGVKTLHDRATRREEARAEQRKGQNAADLARDWNENDDLTSLLYLAHQFNAARSPKAITLLRTLLERADEINTETRYTARLMLARALSYADEYDAAEQVLLQAIGDDWRRIEHWLYLGDIARRDGKLEKAVQFYKYASTRIGDPPFSLYWIEIANYAWEPAQRLAEVLAELGRVGEALAWAVEGMRHMQTATDDERAAAAAVVEQLKEAAGVADGNS